MAVCMAWDVCGEGIVLGDVCGVLYLYGMCGDVYV